MTIKPFVEGTSVYAKISHSDRGTFDAKYRQGIEIVHITHQAQGSVTISSGRLGSVMDELNFGQSTSINESSYFIDEHIPTPLAVMHDGDYVVRESLFPVGEYIDSNDGVIEPFTIRDVASLVSIEGQHPARSIKSQLMAGNENFDGAVETIDNFYEISPKQEPYADTTAMLSTVTISSEQFEEMRAVVPFDDAKTKHRSIVLSTNMDNDVQSAVLAMSPNTDSVIDDTRRFMTAGFVFDDARYRIDSIAYA